MSPSAVVVTAAISAAPVLGLMAFGVVLAIAGHMARNMRVAALGIGALFLATGLMMVLGFASYQDDKRDPRKCSDEPDYAQFCKR
ncbi:hypothetical protein GKE82_21940 [Conexibacter sp. W3-3-2]|uniref:Uncharacterized protein n=1 Tax=Paraconexibacter algicola TaxID=2133960 RepID=A0A2T4UFI8_9ACTN|nr:MULTISPECIES: hypothetical protein [Solirubrobacterales]MTD46877.1 hypothetical protein [Conexibacter sp. W3-3-2]PTL56549.1 hypothetical protein C7Y72_16500 [Paraconexibacter algicola]